MCNPDDKGKDPIDVLTGIGMVIIGGFLAWTMVVGLILIGILSAISAIFGVPYFPKVVIVGAIVGGITGAIVGFIMVSRYNDEVRR